MHFFAKAGKGGLFGEGKTILNGLRCALAIISGKIILNFAFVAACGPLQTHFHGRGRGGGICSAAFSESAVLQAAGSLPLGGAVAQRLRGFKSAEPEKTVKRSSRRIGVNLQFFPV